MEDKNTSRRNFIQQAGVGLAATAALAACAPKEVTVEVEKEVPQEIPAAPWTYVKLDVEDVRKRGHAKYYEGDCCYGGFAAILESLQEKVGFPFTQVPKEMMGFGAGGVSGWGTTCGSLIGACAAINLVTDKATARKLASELLGWYSTNAFPSEQSNQYAVNHEFLVTEYKSDAELPQSVSNSPLCHVSVSNWCRTAEIASGDPRRAERCGRLTGDVAAHAAELLNALADGNFEATFKFSDEATGCMSCHSMGENYDMGQFIQGKGECTDCHEPHN